MDRKGWTLLAISFAGESGLSPVQLQKCIFILGEEQENKVGSDFYEFSPYNYGPFSKLVYQDAEELASEGLVLIERPAGSYATYRITPTGAKRAGQLRSEAPESAVTYLRTLVEWSQQLSFSELLRAIYTKYPKYRANSVFQF
jgi:uncharacterized protein YwgA